MVKIGQNRSLSRLLAVSAVVLHISVFVLIFWCVWLVAGLLIEALISEFDILMSLCIRPFSCRSGGFDLARLLSTCVRPRDRALRSLGSWRFPNCPYLGCP